MNRRNLLLAISHSGRFRNDKAHPPESVFRCADVGGACLWVSHITLVSASHRKIAPKPLGNEADNH